MNLEKKVVETIKKYNLMNKKEKIVVALSGGKDSTSILYILNKLGYNVEGLMIDLKLGQWSFTHNEKMTAFCEENKIPLTIVDLKSELGQGICFIKAVLKKKKGLTGCSVCGTVKRWILNKWAKKLGADKLVTGHNLDDEAQNVLMNFLKGNIMLGANSAPLTGGGNVEISSSVRECPAHPPLASAFPRDDLFEASLTNKISLATNNKGCKSSRGFVQRVKPLFFIPENEIRNYAKKNNFDILYDKCPCAFGTYRVETRDWMKELTDKEKKSIVENFQKIAEKMRSGRERKLQACKICGEPTGNEVCNYCGMLEGL